MLEELSKKDKDWRIIAYKICGCKHMADDLVQDMYLAMHEKYYDNINEWFVWIVIRNLFYNKIKKNKKLIKFDKDITDLIQIKNISYPHKDDTLENRKKINNALSNLDLWDREILLHTSEKSLDALSKETGIHRSTLNYNRKIALKKLKQLL